MIAEKIISYLTNNILDFMLLGAIGYSIVKIRNWYRQYKKKQGLNKTESKNNNSKMKGGRDMQE